MIFSLPTVLREARRAARLSQEQLADRAGLSRMTVQKLEAGSIDPRVSTLVVLVRALGLELTLIPAELKPAVDDFLRSGGRVVAQPSGIGAPPSILDVIARDGDRGPIDTTTAPSLAASAKSKKKSSRKIGSRGSGRR